MCAKHREFSCAKLHADELTDPSLAHTVRTDASVADAAGMQDLLHVLEQYVESLSTRRALMLSLNQ